jgi:hypothetical protein
MLNSSLKDEVVVPLISPQLRPDEAAMPEVERAVRPKTLAAVRSSGIRSRPERNRMIHRPLMNSSGIDGTTLEPKSTLGAAKISPLEYWRLCGVRFPNRNRGCWDMRRRSSGRICYRE